MIDFKILRRLSTLNNNSVLLHDEVTSLKSVVKDGLRDVTEANKRLDPEYSAKREEVGAWRKVDHYDENAHQPLVQSDVEVALKKLNVI